MKKTIKIILIIIFFICFLGLFLRPQPARADFNETVYNAITTYRDFMQSEDNAILSKFFTYNYIGLEWHSSDGSVITYRVNAVVSLIDTQTSSNRTFVRYHCSTGSYYYTSSDGFLIPHSYSGVITIALGNGSSSDSPNGVARTLNFLGQTFYFIEPPSIARYGVVTYCDLTDSYYSDSSDGSSLQRRNLFVLPNTFIDGLISSPSPFSTFGDNIQRSIDVVAPTPVVTTLPPFQPPATVPPVLPPAETVTALPVVTDDSNNYYIDYSPYIDGKFYLPPATDDISLSPAISASGSIISEGFGWLTDSGIFPVLLVLMLVSFAIYNLI